MFIFESFTNENLPESGRNFEHFGDKISAKIENNILLFSIH